MPCKRVKKRDIHGNVVSLGVPKTVRKKFNTFLELWSWDDPEVVEQKPKHPPDNEDGDNTEVAGTRGQKRKSPPGNKDNDSKDLGGQGSGRLMRPRRKGPPVSAK
jgi:hypothetical protein